MYVCTYVQLLKVERTDSDHDLSSPVRISDSQRRGKGREKPGVYQRGLLELEHKGYIGRRIMDSRTICRPEICRPERPHAQAHAGGAMWRYRS